MTNFRQKIERILEKWALSISGLILDEIAKAHEAQCKEDTHDLLTLIVNANTDQKLGTIDYDGIAESVLSELARYEA